MTAIKYLQKGYDAYLAFMVDKRKEEKDLKKVPITNKFEDVFPEGLPELPLRERLNLRLSCCQVRRPYLKLHIESLQQN